MENLSNCQFSIRCLTVWCVPSTDLPGRFCLRRLFTVFPRLLCHSCFGFTVCSTAISTFSTPCLNSKSFLHVVNHMFLPHESNLISEVALWKSLMVLFFLFLYLTRIQFRSMTWHFCAALLQKSTESTNLGKLEDNRTLEETLWLRLTFHHCSLFTLRPPSRSQTSWDIHPIQHSPWGFEIILHHKRRTCFKKVCQCDKRGIRELSQPTR